MICKIEAAALNAARVIKACAQSTVSFSLKEDGSPVSTADLAAESIILEDLARSFPSIPVISEESFERRIDLKSTLGTFFLVDPLDGTREFQAGREDYTINIGFISNWQAHLGVIVAPAKNLIYSTRNNTAIKGSLSLDGEVKNVHEISCREASSEVTAIVSNSRPETVQPFLRINSIVSVNKVGSSLKFCEIAEGNADLYPCLGPTKEWDTAAGHAILRAAGGMVLASGEELRYGKSSSFLNPPFLAHGRLSERSFIIPGEQ